MNEVAGLRNCPSCGRMVTPSPGNGRNDPAAFRCLFCPAVICDWCYSEEHTKRLHAPAAPTRAA